MPPSAMARQSPNGLRLRDGFSTKITFKRFPDVAFFEMDTGPPGVDGGEPIKTSTMFNTVWHTMAARKLKTMTPGKATTAYDPAVLNTIVQMINVEDTITITFPEGSSWAFFGYLQKFEAGENKEGEMPTASVAYAVTNTDPTTGAESGPVVVSVSGT